MTVPVEAETRSEVRAFEGMRKWSIYPHAEGGGDWSVGYISMSPGCPLECALQIQPWWDMEWSDPLEAILEVLDLIEQVEKSTP